HHYYSQSTQLLYRRKTHSPWPGSCEMMAMRLAVSFSRQGTLNSPGTLAFRTLGSAAGAKKAPQRGHSFDRARKATVSCSTEVETLRARGYTVPDLATTTPCA